MPGRPVSAKAARRSSGGVEIDVDAVKDHRRRAPQKLRGHLARCDHRIHSADEEVGKPGFLALRGRIEDQRKAVAEQVQEKSGEHLDIAARVPDADLAVRGRTEAQAQKIAEAQGRDTLRLVRPTPRRAPALGDQRRDGAVDRRAARIAPIQIGDDDLERVEGLVIKFPAHPASPDRIASNESARQRSVRARYNCRWINSVMREYMAPVAAWMKPAQPDRKNRFQKKMRRK